MWVSKKTDKECWDSWDSDESVKAYTKVFPKRWRVNIPNLIKAKNAGLNLWSLKTILTGEPNGQMSESVGEAVNHVRGMLFSSIAPKGYSLDVSFLANVYELTNGLEEYGVIADIINHARKVDGRKLIRTEEEDKKCPNEWDYRYIIQRESALYTTGWGRESDSYNSSAEAVKECIAMTAETHDGRFRVIDFRDNDKVVFESNWVSKMIQEVHKIYETKEKTKHLGGWNYIVQVQSKQELPNDELVETWGQIFSPGWNSIPEATRECIKMAALHSAHYRVKNLHNNKVVFDSDWMDKAI